MSFTKLKFCKSCQKLGNFNDGSPGCIKFKIQVNPAEDYCSWHKMKSDPITCDICKRNFVPTDLSYYLNPKTTTGYWVCADCSNKIGTCATCTFNSECAFANDHSEPQIVMQQVQKGFVTMQTQVKNPHLVKKHCTTCRCSCGPNKLDCIKDNGGIGCQQWVQNF